MKAAYSKNLLMITARNENELPKVEKVVKLLENNFGFTCALVEDGLSFILCNNVLTIKEMRECYSVSKQDYKLNLLIPD